MFAKQLWYTNNFIQCIFLKGNCHLYLHWEISRTISNLMGLSQILVDMEFGKAMDPALMSFSTKSAEPHMVALKRGVRPSYSDELSDDPTNPAKIYQTLQLNNWAYCSICSEQAGISWFALLIFPVHVGLLLEYTFQPSMNRIHKVLHAAIMLSC